MDLNQIRYHRWTSSIPYFASNVIAYSLSIGCNGQCLRCCWEEHPKFHALPTFTSLAVINIMGKVTANMRRLLPLCKPAKHPHVYAEHYPEMRELLLTSGNLTSEARILDVVDRRSGVAVILGIATKDGETGYKICYNEWTSFLMKVPGDEASKPRSNTRKSTGRNCYSPDNPRTRCSVRAVTGE